MKQKYFVKHHQSFEFDFEALAKNKFTLTAFGKSQTFSLLSTSHKNVVLKDEAGQIHFVEIATLEKNEYQLFSQGFTATVECLDEKARRKQSLLSKNSQSAGQVISPMPGKILKIEVVEGQKVEEGQKLVVIEAMKMENEFKATMAGVIKKIYVKPLDVVSAKTLILEIEPKKN